MSEARATARSATIYAIGLIINQMASFLMLPIYTRYLTSADYGVLELLLMTIDIVGLLVGVGLAESIFRFYFQSDDPNERKAVLRTAFFLSACLYCTAGFLGYMAADGLASLVLSGRFEDIKAFRLIFIIFSLEPFHVVPLIFLRAQQKPIIFVIVVTLRLALQLGLNIFFIVYLKSGMFGILFSTLITQMTLSVFLTFFLLRRVGFGFRKTIAAKLLIYGGPIVFSNLGMFIMTFSDRYFLKAYTDLATVGIYSLGYKLGFVLVTLAVSPVFAVWEPKRFEIVGRGDFQEVNRIVFFFFSFLLTTTALAIALFSRDLFRIMSAPEFLEAYRIVPYILIAYIFNSWSSFTNFGIYYRGKTKCLAFTDLVCTATILLLSFILIPTFKAYGAAWATLLTFLLRLGMIHFFSKAFFVLHLQWKKSLGMLVLACGIYCVSQLFLRQDVLQSILINGCFLISFLALIYCTPILGSEYRPIVQKLLRDPFALLRDTPR